VPLSALYIIIKKLVKSQCRHQKTSWQQIRLIEWGLSKVILRFNSHTKGSCYKKFWIHNLTHTHTYTITSMPTSCLSSPKVTDLSPSYFQWYGNSKMFLPCGIGHLHFILSFLGPNIFLSCKHSVKFMSWLVHDGSNFRLIWRRVTL
jgi:hypothetical protein